ncbi:MAG: DRTGG domain-containing protein [Chloroflexota bacterium]
MLFVRQAAPAALPAGLEATAVVVTAIAPSALASLPAQVGGAPVVALVEDRTLAGFSVSEARAMLHADVLVEGDAGDPTCDYLVIAPIASDAGQPYFQRFPSKAVVVRFDKTDMHLAAMQADPACLVLTGGRRPSDYLFDAASAQGIPVLLSRTDTENTVIALEGIFDNTRFQGQRKLERMAGLLGASALFAALNA